MKKFLIITLQYLIKFYNKFRYNSCLELKGNEEILFIRLDRIGDACWTISISKILKKIYPKIKIYILANTYNGFVFKKFDYLFEKITLLDTQPPNYILKQPFSDYLNSIKNYFQFLKKEKFKETYFDYIINHTNRTAGLIEKHLKAKNKLTCQKHKEIGAKYPRCDLLNNIIDKYSFDFEIKFTKKKVLLFIGGKSINQLSYQTYQMISSSLKDNKFEIYTLSDDKQQKSNYYLKLKKNGFFVNKEELEKFIKNFDLVIGIDGGVMHFISLFRPTLIIYTTTNLLATDYVKYVKNFGKRKLWKSKTKYCYYLWKNLNCHGCFQIGCEKFDCKNLSKYQFDKVITFLKEKSIS